MRRYPRVHSLAARAHQAAICSCRVCAARECARLCSTAYVPFLRWQVIAKTLTDAEQTPLKQQFYSADNGRKGFLTATELRTSLRQRGSTDGEIARVEKTADCNGDGRIDYEARTYTCWHLLSSTCH